MLVGLKCVGAIGEISLCVSVSARLVDRVARWKEQPTKVRQALGSAASGYETHQARIVDQRCYRKTELRFAAQR